MNLTINGNIQVSWPISATPAAATAALMAGLGISQASRVGVGRWDGSGNQSITFQLAVNRTTVPTLDITSVQLVVLNVTPPAPYVGQNFSLPSNCSWASPAAAFTTAANGSSAPTPPQMPDLDATTLAAGATAAVAVVQLAAVANPVGTWTLESARNVDTENSNGPLTLAHNATADDVVTAFQAATGVRPASVSVARNQRDGAYISNVWTVRTSMFAGNAIPTPRPVLVTAPTGAAVAVNVTATAADLITGTFRVGLGDFCDSVLIDMDADNADVIGIKISQLPWMARE